MTVVISLQGTQSSVKEFVCKELGVYFLETGTSASYSFLPPDGCHVDIDVDRYVVRRLHGICIHEGELPYHQLGTIVKDLSRGKCVYTKGLQNCRFLEGQGLCPHDLEDLGCPKACMLPKTRVTCKIRGHQRNPYCAERRAIQWDMTFLKKYYLTEKEFLTVGLDGTEPELRLSSQGKSTLTLTHDEFETLVLNASSVMKERIILSTKESSYGGLSFLICQPDEATGGVKFRTEESTNAQPSVPGEFDVLRYTLSKNCSCMLVTALPAVKQFTDHLVKSKPVIQIAFSVVGDQLKRLCAANPQNIDSCTYFLNMMTFLHSHVPLRFLISDFKRRSKGTCLNVESLITTIISQFEYLYANVFPNCA